MRWARIGVGISLALLPAPPRFGLAATETANPDGAAACVEPDRSTADEMAHCLENVRAAADARLNKTYIAALESLEESDRVALREAQRAWVSFRLKDSASLTGAWRAKRNLSVRIDAASADIVAINVREIELRVFLSGPW